LATVTLPPDATVVAVAVPLSVTASRPPDKKVEIAMPPETVVPGNQRLQYLLSPGLQRDHRASLVLLHKPAVADDIGGEDGDQAALDAFFGHLARLFLENTVQEILRPACRGVYQPGLQQWVRCCRTRHVRRTTAVPSVADVTAQAGCSPEP